MPPTTVAAAIGGPVSGPAVAVSAQQSDECVAVVGTDSNNQSIYICIKHETQRQYAGLQNELRHPLWGNCRGQSRHAGCPPVVACSELHTTKASFRW